MRQIQPSSLFVNEVTLEYGYTHFFTYCLWVFSHCNVSFELIQKRPYGEVSLQKSKIFIIWTFIEKVCRYLTIQLSMFPREKEKFGERRWPTQGHLDAPVPAPWRALCLSLLDGAEMEDVVPRLRVGSDSTSQRETHLHPRTQEGPAQGTRCKEKALRRGWSSRLSWEGGGSPILLCFTLFQKYLHWVTI